MKRYDRISASFPQRRTISEAAIEQFQSYNWPGYIRELQSVIREAMIASTGPTLLGDFLPLDFANARPPEMTATFESLSEFGPDSWKALGPKIEKFID